MKKKIICTIAVCLLALSGCNNSSTVSNVTTEVPKTENTIDETEESSSAEINIPSKFLSEMTLEEKIGQLFIIRPERLSFNENDTTSLTGVTDEMLDTISTYNIGGICMFKQNIISPEQVTTYIEDLQAGSEIPMFISVDEEGGLVARIANNDAFNVTQYESMDAIGSTNNTDKALEMGCTIGDYLNDYGFNLDFAPVADVNTNPENIIIGNRAFGSDPNLVASMVNAAINGFQGQNVMCCVKHFPGHGDTIGDTHDGYVSIDKNWDDLKDCELIPFIAAIENDVDTIMVAHITTPNITTDNLPASMSYEMVTEKLRNELGYDGVVTTDAMEMGAIADNYTSATGAVSAINAGVDIILMPENFIEAYNGVYEAVINGEISEERIDESVLRILNLKYKYGLIE